MSKTTFDIISACQSAHQIATEGSDWFAHSPEAKAPIYEGERRQLFKAQFRAKKLLESASKPLGAGVFGASQTGKSYLISALARSEDSPLIVRLGQAPIDFLRKINPEGGKESTGLVTRFSIEKQTSPDGYPVSVRLLSQLDLVKVLANSFFEDFDPNEEKEPNEDMVVKALSAAKEAATDGTRDGLTSVEIDDLSSYIHDRFGYRPTIKALDNAGFWSTAEDLIPRLHLKDRLALFAFLWGGIDTYTDLYKRLFVILESLDFAEQIFCEEKALLPRETSIIDVAILKDLLEDSDDTINVVSRSNKTLKIARPLLTAIVAELRLQMENVPFDYLNRTDLLDFPGARSRHNYKDPAEKLKDPEILSETLIRGKVAYLFERYTKDFELNALAVCVVPGNQEVRTLPDYITPWIRLMHGSTAEHRSGQINALFLCLTKFDMNFEDKIGGSQDSSDRWSNAIDTGLVKFFSKSGDWVENWADGAPFQNTFWIRNPSVIARGLMSYKDAGGKEVLNEKGDPIEQGLADPDRIAQMKREYSENALVTRHISTPETAWDEAFRLKDGGVSYLAEKLGAACVPDLKERQIAQALSELSAKMRRTLEKYYVSEDNAELRTKRLAEVKSASRSIMSLAKSEDFGGLLSLCTVNEDEIRSALRRQNVRNAKDGSGASNQTMSDIEAKFRSELPDDLADILEPDETTEEPPKFSAADPIFEFWNEKLFGLLELDAHRYAIDAQDLSIIVREITEGAETCGLRERLSRKIAPSLNSVDRSKVDSYRVSMVASQVLNTFVMTLGQGSGTSVVRGRRASGEDVFSTSHRLDRLTRLEGVKSRQSRFITDWVIALNQLVKMNLENSDDGTAASEENRALGRILKQVDQLESTLK